MTCKCGDLSAPGIVHNTDGCFRDDTLTEVIPEVKLASQLTRQAVAENDHALLMKFYGVNTIEALVNIQARHIEKLQAKLQLLPPASMRPQRVREG